MTQVVPSISGLIQVVTITAVGEINNSGGVGSPGVNWLCAWDHS